MAIRRQEVREVNAWAPIAEVVRTIQEMTDYGHRLAACVPVYALGNPAPHTNLLVFDIEDGHYDEEECV